MRHKASSSKIHGYLVAYLLYLLRMLQSEWQGAVWREEEKNGQAEQPPHGLGKISEQKGILGPGPAELRFSEAL
ncbi:hypothetical protein QUC31_006284 [Theobroma cacao]